MKRTILILVGLCLIVGYVAISVAAEETDDHLIYLPHIQTNPSPTPTRSIPPSPTPIPGGTPAPRWPENGLAWTYIRPQLGVNNVDLLVAGYIRNDTDQIVRNVDVIGGFYREGSYPDPTFHQTWQVRPRYLLPGEGGCYRFFHLEGDPPITERVRLTADYFLAEAMPPKLDIQTEVEDWLYTKDFDTGKTWITATVLLTNTYERPVLATYEVLLDKASPFTTPDDHVRIWDCLVEDIWLEPLQTKRLDLLFDDKAGYLYARVINVSARAWAWGTE